MWNSTLKSLSFAAMTAACAMVLAPTSSIAAPAAGGAFAPGALPQGLFTSQLIEKVQQRRRARRRAGRRARRAGRRYRRGRRYRGPFIVVPGVAVPSYYYGEPYYDPYYYDYTPAPAPGGSCARWSRRCTANWGYGNQDYWGCMHYHGCH